MTTRGDCEKYQRGRPNRLMRAVLVSYVSEQRVLRILPPVHTQSTHLLQRLATYLWHIIIKNKEYNKNIMK